MTTGVKTSQEAPAGPLTGAELVRIVQNGGNAKATTGAMAGLAYGVMPRTFGAVGDGVTDDTAAVQAAIDSLPNGGVVNCSGGRWLIDSADLIVKKGVTLWGPWLNLGEPDGQDYSNIQSAFIVNSAYTIRLAQEFSAIEGMGIFRKGLTTPTDATTALAAIAAFAGTAITVGYGVSKDASDTYVGNCLVLGFEYAYYNDYNERPRIEYLSADCTNGLYLNRVYDMCHVNKCHLWPFVTAHRAWTLTLDIWRRQGVGYYLNLDVDWGQASECFDYGHDVGYEISGSDNVVLLNCGSDNYKTNDTYSVGFYLHGDNQNINMIACKSSSHYRNIKVDLTGVYTQAVKIIGGNIWATSAGTGRGIEVIAGNVIVNGVSFFDGPLAVHTGASAGFVSVDNCTFDAIVTPFSFNNENKVAIGSGNIFIGTVSDPTYGRRFTTNGNGRSYEAVYSATGSAGIVSRRSRGTVDAPAAVSSGDALHSIGYTGWDGSAWVRGALFRAQAEGVISSGVVPASFIWTTRNLAGTEADRLAINSEGTFYPLTTATYDLGTPSLRWGTLYTADLSATGLPVYANDAAAGAGGLVQGRIYQTATGEVRVKL